MDLKVEKVQANRLLDKYEEQLPKPENGNFWVWFGRFSAAVGIIGVGVGLNYYDQRPPEFVLSLYLCAVTTFFIVYIVYRETKKRHRYSESIYFQAHTSHLIKDYLQDFKSGRAGKNELHQLNERIVNDISKCFTLLKGKRCNVCIKALEKNEELVTYARDTSSSKRYQELHSKYGSHKHFLSENSDFSLLFDQSAKYGRYFLENNLVRRWRKNVSSEEAYRNSSFKFVGMPKLEFILGFFPHVRHWRLSYRSTLVCPIRHITTKMYEDEDCHQYWGFLCIDSNSTGIFDRRIDPELAYSFANQLYILMSQVNETSKLHKEIGVLNHEIDDLYEIVHSIEKEKS